MSVAVETNVQPGRESYDALAIRDHLISVVESAPLEREPFCHIYLEGVFPPAIYPALLQSFPAPEAYEPLNPRLYSRADGKSTRDLFHLTSDKLATLAPSKAAFWKPIVSATTDPAFRRAVFAKLAPDLAERFGISEDKAREMECAYEVTLYRDTEDYRIKPHPDGLNKIVTMQFYLPPDASLLDLGTSLFRRHRGLLGSTFEEIKRFQFNPNSAYAFAVSDSAKRKSWHGRDRLSGFTGVRNTLMVLFQQRSPRNYTM
jgi:hypothetical protein